MVLFWKKGIEHMGRALYILILLFLPNILFAESAVIQVSKGSCSPNINNITGNVTIYCNGVDHALVEKLNKMPSLIDYNRNIDELNLLKTNVADLGEKIKIINDNISNSNKNSDNLYLLKRENLKYNITLNQLLLEQQKLSSIFSEDFIKLEEEIKSDSKQLVEKETSQLADKLEFSLSQNIQALRLDIEHKIMRYDASIDDLYREIERIDNDLSFLMVEYFNGNFSRNILFYSFSIGGILLNNDVQTRYAGEIEFFIPKIKFANIKGSFFFETAHIDWEENIVYPTLSGLQEREIANNHDLNYVGLGTRFFPFPWHDEFNFSINMSGGHTIVCDEDTFYYSIGCSIEYFRQSVRLAFETRWETYPSIQKSNVVFNPFGDALCSNKEEKYSGFYFGLRLSFR